MLTAQGFVRKRYDDYLLEMQDQAKELFGADVNLSDRSPLGQFIKLVAYGRAEENELAEEIYDSAYVELAEGISLDHAAKRIGLSRIQATKAVGEVTFSVDEGTNILSGMIVATKGGIEFVTTSSATDDDGDGLITVGIEAVEPGTNGNTPGNTIVEINTPISGVKSVTNNQATDEGRNTETDSEFRNRYFRSLSNAGGASMPSIRAALLELTGVIDASVDENDTLEIVDGIPPKSIAPFVYGGDDQSIADTIFNRKTGGIQSYGSTTVSISDTMGKQHAIGFSRPTVVDIWVKLTITKNAEYQQYPVDGDNQVKTRIIEHIGGVDADGTKYDGRGLDADVIQYKLIAAIADIPGIDDVVVELSTDNVAYSESNVAIDKTSIAQTDYNKVVIQ